MVFVRKTFFDNSYLYSFIERTGNDTHPNMRSLSLLIIPWSTSLLHVERLHAFNPRQVHVSTITRIIKTPRLNNNAFFSSYREPMTTYREPLTSMNTETTSGQSTEKPSTTTTFREPLTTYPDEPLNEQPSSTLLASSTITSDENNHFIPSPTQSVESPLSENELTNEVSSLSAPSSSSAETFINHEVSTQSVPSSTSIKVMETEVPTLSMASTDEFVNEVSKQSVASSSSKQEFVNDGLFSWMVPQLEKMGYAPGKTTFYGAPISVDSELLDESISTSKSEKMKTPLFIDKADPILSNIGFSERQRRAGASQIFLTMTLSYSIVSSLFWDDGSIWGHLVRFGIYLPLALFMGYRTSAQYGLCNIAQVGLIDKEISMSDNSSSSGLSCNSGGLVKIEDPNLAKNLMERVNSMNLDLGINAILLASTYAALPHVIAAKLAAVTLVLWPLHAWGDKSNKNKA